jgi:hypothetical protein
MLVKLFMVLCAGFLDRVRGGFPEGRPGWVGRIAKYCIGFLMTALVSSNPWIILGGTVLIGELSWRQDNGWRGRWVTGEGKSPVHPLLWGLVWAVPFIALAWWEPLLGLYLVTAPLGAWAGIEISARLPAFPKVLDLRHAWPWSELITLPLIAIFQIAAMLIMS